jgi:histone H3/H4
MMSDGGGPGKGASSSKPGRFHIPADVKALRQGREGTQESDSLQSVPPGVSQPSNAYSQPTIESDSDKDRVKPPGKERNRFFVPEIPVISVSRLNPPLQSDQNPSNRDQDNIRGDRNEGQPSSSGENLKRTSPAGDEEIIKRPTTKVKTTMQGSKPNPKGPKGPGNKQLQKNISSSETKLRTRNSLIGPEVSSTLELGYNIPSAVYKSIIKEVVKEMAAQDAELKISTESINYLKIASENFLVSRFRMANIVRRARGRQTLSKIDVETVDLIVNDPFLRRKSCPQVVIT